MKLAEVRKAIVAAVAFAAVLATQLPPGTPDAVKRWVPVVLAAGTLLGVYGAKNADPPSRQVERDPPQPTRADPSRET